MINTTTDVFNILRNDDRLSKLIPEVNKYFSLKSKIKNLSADIFFNKKCLKRSVFPNYLKPFVKACKQEENLRLVVCKKVMQSQIAEFYKKRSVMELEAYHLHLKLAKEIDSVLWKNLEIKLYDYMCRIFFEKKNTLKSKFYRLSRSKTATTEIDTDEVVLNLSSYDLSSEEKRLLSKGLKTCHLYSNRIEDFIVDINGAAAKVDWKLKNAFKNECIPVLEKLNETKGKRNYIEKSMKNLKSQNLVITKADKGNRVVVLDKDEYIRRTEEMLATEEFQELDKSPLSKCVSEVNSALKDIRHIMSEDEKKSVKTSNPKIPKLYTLPKIHKEGDKMRPIVSQIDSPTYKVSKWLLKNFKILEKFESLSVRNSYEFIDETKQLTLSEDEVLISFDVKSLYPSVPVKKALKLLEDWLKKNGLVKKRIDEFVKLTKLCIEQKYLQFNERFYLQVDGLNMGNPLSEMLSNLFMSDLEINVRKKFPGFRFWRRYVDDIFCVMQKDKVAEGLEVLNNLEPTVKFTHEMEEHQRLPFLDLQVIRTESGKIEFDIYRKKTHVDSYINKKSYNPPAHKVAIFNCLIHRMNRVPLTKERKEKEWSKILEIAEKNGFLKEDVWKLRKRKEYKRRLREMTTLDEIDGKKEKFASITYHPKLSTEFSKIFKKYGIKPAHVNRSNLKSMFHADLKDETSDEQKSGIYQIECNGCEKVYVGKTKRSIKTRGSEHRRNAMNEEVEKSAVAKHFWEEGHDINFAPKLIKGVQKVSQLDIWEGMEMYKRKEKLMNTELECTQNKLFEVIGKNVEEKIEEKNNTKMNNVQKARRAQKKDVPAPAHCNLRRSERLRAKNSRVVY